MTDALDELAKAAQSRPIPQRQVEVPEYPGIVRGARLINGWAWVFRILGGLIGVTISVAYCYYLWKRAGADSAADRTSNAMSYIGCLVISLFLEAIGTLLRLLAQLSLAQRDIAVNTFLMRFRR